MTRSPVLATLLPLLPLAALGWPLARVIHQEGYTPVPTAEVVSGPLATADLALTSAHPFTTATVAIGDTSWTFTPDDAEKEIHYRRDLEVILTVTVQWPEDTPETAILLELRPEGQFDRRHTLWGWGEVTEEITFRWEEEQ